MADPKPTYVRLRHVGSDTNPVGTEHKFIALLLDQDEKPMSNISLTGGIIQGVNSGGFGGTTDAKGECTFSYVGENAGEDNIEIYWEHDGEMEPIEYLTKIWYVP